MQFKVHIESEVMPVSTVITVTFTGDKRNKKFEIFCNFNPFYEKRRKWEIWQVDLKFNSEEITLPDGTKIYQTFFTCDKAVPIEQITIRK